MAIILIDRLDQVPTVALQLLDVIREITQQQRRRLLTQGVRLCLLARRRLSPLPFFGPRFVLEPQAQIIWQQVSFDNANDGLGPVGLGTTFGATAKFRFFSWYKIASGRVALVTPVPMVDGRW